MEVMRFYRQLRRHDVEIECSRTNMKLKKLADNIKVLIKNVLYYTQSTRPNLDASNPKDYRHIPQTIPFLDSIFVKLQSRFADKRAHYELTILMDSKLCYKI